MVKTEYLINNSTVSYEIKDNGYDIYLDDKLWISQYEPYIPYKELGYEGSCLKQIEELTKVPEDNQDIVEDIIINDNTKEDIKELSDVEEAIFNTNVNTEYSIALQELNM